MKQDNGAVGSDFVILHRHGADLQPALRILLRTSESEFALPRFAFAQSLRDQLMELGIANGIEQWRAS